LLVYNFSWPERPESIGKVAGSTRYSPQGPHTFVIVFYFLLLSPAAG
jgi:hypothetical protein